MTSSAPRTAASSIIAPSLLRFPTRSPVAEVAWTTARRNCEPSSRSAVLTLSRILLTLERSTPLGLEAGGWLSSRSICHRETSVEGVESANDVLITDEQGEGEEDRIALSAGGDHCSLFQRASGDLVGECRPGAGPLPLSPVTSAEVDPPVEPPAIDTCDARV